MADREQRATREAGSAADSELAGRIAVLEDRLAELEAHEAASEPLDRLLSDMVPAEVRDHMRAARKEQLLAARSFLDHWIERLERKPMPKERRRRESIPLE